jgi:translocator protein
MSSSTDIYGKTPQDLSFVELNTFAAAQHGQFRAMTLTQEHPTKPRTAAQTWLGLVVIGAAVALASVVGALAASSAAGQYAQLEQPSWAPPSWLFGPVWTVLYVMIAISGWLVWKRTGLGKAMWVFTAQLVLNTLWTPLFFGADMFALAFVDIAALWVLIGLTIYQFAKVSRPAAALLVPYWAWVTFASALNFAIWQLN